MDQKFSTRGIRKPESIKKIKDHHEKQLENLKSKRAKQMIITHFLKGKMWWLKKTYLWTTFQVHA